HQEHLVLLVAAGRQVGPWHRQFHHIGVGQEVRQQLLLFQGRQLELGIGQDAQQFTGRLPADQRLQLLLLPGVAYPGQASCIEDQRRQHDVGVEHDPAHQRRAQATASSTSCSVIPSCSSFSRTAWAFWTRTGVRTIRPPSTVTSKYSAASTPDTAALGSVIWFFEVSLASMGSLRKFQRKSYFLTSFPTSMPSGAWISGPAVLSAPVEAA